MQTVSVWFKFYDLYNIMLYWRLYFLAFSAALCDCKYTIKNLSIRDQSRIQKLIPCVRKPSNTPMGAVHALECIVRARMCIFSELRESRNV